MLSFTLCDKPEAFTVTSAFDTIREFNSQNSLLPQSLF
jgi:hypothetical protein